MVAGEVTRPDGDFQRQPHPAFLAEYAGAMERPSSKSDLVRVLERTHQHGADRIRAAGAEYRVRHSTTTAVPEAETMSMPLFAPSTS